MNYVSCRTKLMQVIGITDFSRKDIDKPVQDRTVTSIIQ